MEIPGSALPFVEDALIKYISVWTQDYRLRAVTRVGKQWKEADRRAPAVVAGDLPSNVAGEIDENRIPAAPAIIVQAASGEDQKWEGGGFVGFVCVHIGVITYDDAESKQGHRDTLNLIQNLRFGLWKHRLLGDPATGIYWWALCHPWITWQRILPTMGSHPLYYGLVQAHYSMQVPTALGDEGEDYGHRSVT
jgi:hypothetical protein